MRKITSFAFLFLPLCLGISMAGGAECWRWVPKQIEGPSPPENANKQMVYDPNRQAIALSAFDPRTAAFSLWHYDGNCWTKDWEGQIPVNSAVGLYFDENLDTLVFLGYSIQSDYESGLLIAFSFNPSIGFTQIAYIWATLVFGDQSVAFYGFRKRAVIVGMEVAGHQYDQTHETIEFDGSHFSIIINPTGVILDEGSTAYDPEINRVVYYGGNGGRENHTFEYDGTTWNEITTGPGPVSFDHLFAMAFDPAFDGLLVVSCDIHSSDTWIYKDHQWTKMSVDEPTPYIMSKWLSIDAKRERAVLFGWSIESNLYFLWELIQFRHCRPLAKP